MKRGTTKERGASSGALRVLALVLPVVVLVLLAAAAVRFFFFENDKLRQIASSPPSSSAPGEKIDPAAEGPDAHEPSAGTDDGDTPGESGGEPDDIADGAEQNHDITGGKYTYPASFLPYEVYASEENIPPLKNVKVKLNKGIFSACAQLVNLDTGETVYKNNASAPNYPASLTKILTAVVVLESGIPTGEFVTITEEMLSGLFESGASVDDLMAADAALQAADGEDVITALEQVADEAQALSGASVSGFSDEQLVVDLERGTYAVVATPSDGSAPQWATFRVTEGGDEAVDEPQARYDAELSGSSFDMPETVVTGENLWKLSSTGDQPLVVSFYRLLPGSTADDLLAYLGAGGGQGRQPYDESESFVAVTPGASAIVTLDLEAGDWVAVRTAAPAPTAAAEEAAMIAEFRVD